MFEIDSEFRFSLKHQKCEAEKMRKIRCFETCEQNIAQVEIEFFSNGFKIFHTNEKQDFNYDFKYF